MNNIRMKTEMNRSHWNRKVVCGLLLSSALSSGIAQKESPRLIVRADDMGAFHAVNVACIEGYTNGIATSVEVMAVTPWFPEAVKMLRDQPGLDVGLHLTITSEWDHVKWRPLTLCPSLTDQQGYFYPMIFPNPAYPGQAITENKWILSEIEHEFRAQIEMALRTIPQISHITGHMLSTGFDKEVALLAKRLGEEYNIPAVDREAALSQYNFTYIGYDGPSKTSAEKESAFIRMLGQLEAGKSYLFLDHPAFNNDEMQTVGHIGYEAVAVDRQGVTDLFTSRRVKEAIQEKGIELINYNDLLKALPRSRPQAEKVSEKAIDNYFAAVEKSGQELHSLMLLRHGKVVAERWLGNNAANKPHVMWSVSKTYTATAIGFAVAEGKLQLTDKVCAFFPDQLPATASDYLKEMEIRDLLTMSSGHDIDPTAAVREKETTNWIQTFFEQPLLYKPGTQFVYNSLATFMLSAIIQQVTGEKLIDYLYPRLFRPLGIVGVEWDENPQGINIGGWGLHIKTEDMAKLGQFFLQKGQWNGQQLLPVSWFDEATRSHIESLPAGVRKGQLKVTKNESDWLQGYGYQMWRCRHNAYRADGRDGQFIIILPEEEAVIVATANIGDMQAQLNLIWKYLLPALK